MTSRDGRRPTSARNWTSARPTSATCSTRPGAACVPGWTTTSRETASELDHPDPDRDLACKEFVELITAYLDGALPDDLRADVDEHLDMCDGCQNVLAQWRTIINLAGQLTEADVENTDELTRDRLISMFRGLRRR